MVIPTLELEQKLWLAGYIDVVGIDEAGRGPLAGPVVAGAVILHSPDQMVEGVRDSKKMTHNQREKAYDLIIEKSSAYGVGIVDSWEIDSLGIQLAVKTAMLSALSQVLERFPKVSYLIVDGKNVSMIEGFKMDRITKGDMLHYSISAGSVLAKVTRDRLMMQEALKYPEYGFEKHVGYGTKMHIDAIKKFGVTPIHRKSFEPIKSMSF